MCLFTHPMSCCCDRSLENGMKSTMLRRALDLLEPAARTRKVFHILVEIMQIDCILVFSRQVNLEKFSNQNASK